jgi:hypothetical protein
MLLEIGDMKFKTPLLACVVGIAIAGCSDHQDTRRSTMPPAGGEASGYNGTAGTSTEDYQARPGAGQTRSQTGVTGTDQYDQTGGTSSDVGNDPSGAGMPGTPRTGQQPGNSGVTGSQGTGTTSSGTTPSGTSPSGTIPTSNTGPYNGPGSGPTTGTTSGSNSSGSSSSPGSSGTGVNAGSASGSTPTTPR